MLCLKKRRTYSFTQGTCVDLPRRSKKDTARYEGSLNMAITTLPRKNRSNREERPSGMVLTVTEDTPADMLAGSMELLVQLPREHHLHTQRVTVQRSTPMMDLLVQIATAHKLAASNYTLQAIGERGLVLPHQPNTPIGALDALQVKLLPKQCTFVPKKVKHANQPFETTFRLQVHLPRNQLYVSRVSPKMNLGEILNEVCREKNLDKHKYELRHPVNLEEILDLNLSLQDYHLQEVTLYAKQGRTLGSALSSQDIMALQRQEERRRQQAKQSVFGFMFKKSKESSVSTDSLEGRSVSPARSDETGRSASPLQPPTRPQRKRRLAPKPPASSNQEQQQQQQPKQQQEQASTTNSTIATTTMTATATSNRTTRTTNPESSKEKMLIGHSRNSSDSSGYHEASVLSDNPDTAGRLPETLPRRSRAPGTNETPRKLAHTSQSSKSLGNLAVTASGTSLDRALSSSSLSSTGFKKKRAAPPPPVSRPLSSAISTQALERIDDSEESLTSDMDPSKPPSDIGVPSKASSDIGVSTIIIDNKSDHSDKMNNDKTSDFLISDVKVVEDPVKVENARVDVKREMVSAEELAPLPKPRNVVRLEGKSTAVLPPPVPKRRLVPPVVLPRSLSKDFLDHSSITSNTTNTSEDVCSSISSFSSGGIEFEATKHGGEIISSQNDENNSTSLEDDKLRTNLVFTKHAKSMNDLYNVDSNSSYKSCTVISMIPKCNHFDSSRKKSSSCSKLVEKNDKGTSEKDENDFNDFTSTKDDAIFEDISSKSTKRPKVYRSPSELNDFQIDRLKRKKRHFTSQSNDFTFALNLNLMYKSDKEFDVEKNNGQMERANAVEGISDVDKKLCDTDVLLHKVSETLSSSSLTSSNEETDNVYSVVKKKNANSREESLKDNEEMKNQQDTSDYVSALEEDSSIADWEYQLPAPPSAFRDNDSQIFDGYDTVTLRSVDAFKETLVENRDDTKDNDESLSLNRINDTERKTMTFENKQQPVETHKNNFLQKCNKKEIILELENKIEKGTLSRSNKESDSRKVPSNNLKVTPNVAPIDNTLSNFTITTYTRQKSIDIFKDEKDSSQLGDEPSRNKKTEPKISNNDIESKIDIVQRSKSHASAICKPKLKNEIEDNRTIDVKIGKSDNAVSSDVNDSKQIGNTPARTNDKFSQWRENMLKRQEETTKEKQLQSIQVLKNILPQLTNSQPAEENVSKERNVGLREKVKNSKDIVNSLSSRFETESNENSVTPNVFSTHGESHVTAQDENKGTMQKETNTKRRYVYNGPPAISLGSWSERPSVKVQIKMDTDYKFGRDKLVQNNATMVPSNVKEQSKEINEKREPDDLTKKLITHATASGFKKVTLNKTKNEERPIVTSVELKKTNVEGNEETRRQKDNDKDNENLIDTRPLNFQELTKTFRLDIDQRIKPQRSNANRHSEYYGSQQEFIRKSIETNKQNGHAKFDEFPITKKNAFQKNHHASSINENHNPNFGTTEKKQFTSIVGINSYNHRHQDQSVQKNNNVSLKNNVNNIKVNPISAPVVKGFKVSTIPFTESKVNKIDKMNQNKDVVDGQPPKAPTMPVIMGVTLKSANARPKSMPINIDSRDMLLESIRNFGGRGKLKNAAERY